MRWNTKRPRIRLIWLVGALWSLWLLPHAFGAEATAQKPLGIKADLLIVRDGWGTAERETVAKLLGAAADELTVFFEERTLPPIIVYPKGGPVTLHQRGPGGEYCIRLDTGDTYWSQYVYQFAHELCHVLCRHDTDDHGNTWFEESLCEVASLFVLRRLSERWRMSPPFEHWKSYAPHLRQYANTRIEKHGLPKEQSLAGWYTLHADQLHGSRYRRELNTKVACALLPLFEQTPRHWEAVERLNTSQATKPRDLEAHLRDWHDHCPTEHRPFVRRIAKEFGVTWQSR